ncbi:hypothetical protein PT7_0248 [Pusillimonas sp. T7-7]|uniref:hypothetical protein n=1 Tax=Pusillimonas sp. (strain T7-7) TaxID=1007105 RepID=UPI00020849AF|nr:hypothetical protein [Pusillimonas sp. T7-7]AEC18788.1 hypothetical protein PT7_0248 [Pusillimonas sp. T7-7]
MDNPQILLESLKKTVSDWRPLGRRAQLEAAMPLLEILAKHKTEYAVLSSLLHEYGLEIKSDALRQALLRWRKRQHVTPTQTSVLPASRSAQIESTAVDIKNEEASHVESGQQTATDKLIGSSGRSGQPFQERLKEIREQHIDLDEIVRAGRKLDRQR